MHLSPAETARQFGVSIKALRLYEDRGLLSPVRSEAGWRAYGPDQFARLHQILALKGLGLSLASIGQLLASADALDTVLALQEQALAMDGQRVAHSLTLIQKARAQIKAGHTLSIDDLATLSKETSMTLARATLFHPALVPHQGKYFSPGEIQALSTRQEFDYQEDYALWEDMIAELKALAKAGDPAAPGAADLALRWIGRIELFTRGDKVLTEKLRRMVDDAFADPVTAAQMPYTREELAFLGKIFENLTAP